MTVGLVAAKPISIGDHSFARGDRVPGHVLAVLPPRREQQLIDQHWLVFDHTEPASVAGPVVCPDCSASFANGHGLAIHVGRQHSAKET